MPRAQFDVITIGGGLAGAAFARTIAQRGLSVLVLERTSAFTDRIRGEWIAPWGVAEAKNLDLFDLLMHNCGHALPRCTTYMNGVPQERDLVATTRHGVPAIGLFHPDMQAVILQAARDAGAEVWRGAVVRSVGVDAGGPWVEVQIDREMRALRTRLVVGADGRHSLMRRWGRFTVQHGKSGRLAAGLMLENVAADSGSSHMWIDTRVGQAAYFFPQAEGRGRAYVTSQTRKFSGLAAAPRFIQASYALGVAQKVYAHAKPFGILATIDLTDSWVAHPYQNGIALIGDAAGTSDPTWGQGLSTVLRDVRVLSHCLEADDAWDQAGHAYAGERESYFGALLKYESWMEQMLLETGPQADERRAHAMSLWRDDRTRVPDLIFSGPENAVLDECARRRYFGEE
jgi:2-polyprenyl-6-methoxyphenol hydroxylase-like FAD-dependent oxidoreductase